MNLPFLKKPSSTSNLQPAASETTPSAQFAAGITTIQDILAPDAIEVDFSHLKIGSKIIRTLFVAGYPRFVTANWLSPLINFDHSLDVSMFIYPIEGKGVLDDLRRKITEMEAEINSDIQRGRIPNIETQIKLEDAKALQEQLAKGAERFYQFGLYITLTADNLEELDHLTKQIQSTLGALLIIAKPATLQMESGFKTTQPLGQDYLNITRNMDTTSLATTFPFTSSELTANDGIMYGINEHNDSLVIFDRFTMENANMVVFAKSGAGKCLTYQSKVMIRRENGDIKISEIGQLVNDLMAKNPVTAFSGESDGVLNPEIQVLTYDQNFKTTWANVEVAARKTFNKRRKLYRITTQSGREVTVTPDHQMIILRNGKIRAMRAEAVASGESIPIPRHIYIPDPAQNICLKPAELLPFWPNSLPQKVLLDENFTYLLGLITSEGHIRPDHLQISNTNPTIQKTVKTILASLGLNATGVDKKDGTIRTIIVRPGRFGSFIQTIGGGGRAGNKRVPPLIFSVNNQRAGAYLRGYFDGDGGVEKHEVAATTKSKDLASDLAYLLLRFGIIARIHPRQKTATNTKNRTKNTYYQISISGKDQINKFAQAIGFSHPEKLAVLSRLTEQLKIVNGNTNVDTIPSLVPLFRQLHSLLFAGARISPGQNFINIKNGKYNPSPTELLKHISACRQRIRDIKSQHDKIWKLGHLMSIDELIRRGRQKSTNSLLWKELESTWQMMKNKQVQPRLSTVLRAYKTVTGETITREEIIDWTQQSYDVAGESIWIYNKNLSGYQTNRKSDTLYQYLWSAGQNLFKKYRSLQLKIRHAERVLHQLETLANSNLCWDPIAKIETIKHREKYVYDLQVDNGVFLAGHGGMFVHNSFLVKLESLRSLMFDSEIIVIDPEDEYRRMCEAVNGQYIEFSFNAAAKINPFDLPRLASPEPSGEGGPTSSTFSPDNELSQKLLSLHSLMKIMLGDMDATQEAILDRALVACYKAKGITPDPTTQNNEPPLLEDLYKAFIGMEEPQAANLAARLEKFVKGSFRGLFDQRTNVDIKNEFVVFGIKNLEDALRPIAMFMILDFIWTRIKSSLKRRLLIVDEAWYLMKNRDSATFLYSIAKRARKYYLGLTTITQDVEDFLSSDYGKAIVTNSSLQILMKQSAAAVDKLGEVFYLSEGEKQLLLSAEVGEGLFFAGQNHVAIKVLASDDEHKLITSKPQELIEMSKISSIPPAGASPVGATPRRVDVDHGSGERPSGASDDEHKLITSKPQELLEMRNAQNPPIPPIPTPQPIQPITNPAPSSPLSPLPTTHNPQPTTPSSPSVEFTSIFENPPKNQPRANE